LQPRPSCSAVGLDVAVLAHSISFVRFAPEREVGLVHEGAASQVVGAGRVARRTRRRAPRQAARPGEMRRRRQEAGAPPDPCGSSASTLRPDTGEAIPAHRSEAPAPAESRCRSLRTGRRSRPTRRATTSDQGRTQRARGPGS
jgi:hypothetical protein